MKTPLINRSKVKRLALDCAQQRARKFTRVSEDFLIRMESQLKSMVITAVANHPSVGLTIK